MPSAVEWEKTSIPVIQKDKRRGKWRLRLRYTPRKSAKLKQVSSADFPTREEAEAAASWWRLSWEQGNEGHGIETQTDPDEVRTEPADVPQGEFSFQLFMCTSPAEHFLNDAYR